MGKLRLNQIYKGDCIALFQQLPPQSIDMIFADPPYNLSGKSLHLKGNKTGGDWSKVNANWDTYSLADYQTFSDTWIGLATNSLKEAGSIYVCCSQHNLEVVLRGLRKANCKVNNIIVWQKLNPMPNTTKRLYTHSIEFVIWAVKGKGWTFNAKALRDINPETQKDGTPRMMRDVWGLPVVQGSERLKSGDGKALHPTQKPVELVRRAIIASTNLREVVLDPFMGSGTTAVAAKLEGRNWIGFEQNLTYVQAARERIKVTKAPKIKKR